MKNQKSEHIKKFPPVPNLLNCFLILFICSSLYSDNWPRFRGPNGSGLAKDLDFNYSWTEKQYSWVMKLPGVGHSSPVIWKNKLITTCADSPNGLFFILCIDAKQGTTIWQKKFTFSPYAHHKFNSFASCTPCIDGDFLFASWTTPESNNLACLTHDGEIKWQRNLGEYKTQHGSGFSPIVYKDILIVSHDHENDSSLMALDRRTGKIIWKTKRIGSKPSASTPFILTSGLGNDQIVSSSMSHGCYSVDVKTGNILWETGIGTLDKRAVSSPFKSGNFVFATCGSGMKGSRLISVNPFEQKEEKIQIAYTLTRDVPYVPTPLAIDQLVFLLGDGGIASCMERKSGKILWRERLEGNYFASPVAIGKTVYVVSREGLVTTLNFDSRKMKILGKTKLNDLTHNTPAVANSSIFFRTYSKLFCLPSKYDRL